MMYIMAIQLVLVLILSHVLYMRHIVKADKKADAEMLLMAVSNKHEKDLKLHELNTKTISNGLDHSNLD